MSTNNAAIEKAKEHFAGVIMDQLERIEKMKTEDTWTDYKKLNPVIVGVCPGDGIGLEISKHARRVLEYMLADECKNGHIEFRDVLGLTIENRAGT